MRSSIYHTNSHLFLVFFALCLVYSCSGNAAKIKHGIADLQGVNWQNQKPISLSGQWKFQANCFLPAHAGNHDFKEQITVPSSWDGEIAAKKGYASYGLHLKVDSTATPLALKLTGISTAYRIYINGVLYSEVGQVGKSPNNSVAQLQANIIPLPVGETEFQLLIHVSNYHYRVGGIWKDIELAQLSTINDARNQLQIQILLIAGVLFAFGCYHVGFFNNKNHRQKSYPIFGALCFVGLIRLLGTGEFFILDIFPSLPFQWRMKMEAGTFFLFCPIGLLLSRSLFPQEINKNVSKLAGWIGACSFICCLLLPAQVYSHLIPTYRIITLIGAVYTIYAIGIATYHNREGAVAFLLGIIALISTGIHDILLGSQLINSFEIIHWGLLVMIISQAYTLSIQFSSAITQTQILSQQLLDANLSLESKIEKRTLEIQSKNNELRNTVNRLLASEEETRQYAEELLVMNEQLSKTSTQLETSLVNERKVSNQLDTVIKDLKHKSLQASSSLRYAQKLQNSLLPPAKAFRKSFKEHFLLYLPKDVVSGDFYWMKQLGHQTIVVVADCTGHGVPGALMSMIGHASLNELILSEGLRLPDQILEGLHVKIMTALRQRNGRNSDGMDIGIVLIEPLSTNRVHIQYAGSKLALLYEHQNELLELAGTNRILGGVQRNPKAFVLHSIVVPSHTQIYLLTDGLKDQHNSSRKKFGKTQVHQLIKQNMHLPMGSQKRILYKAFKTYRQHEYQRDDITVLGFRL